MSTVEKCDPWSRVHGVPWCVTHESYLPAASPICTGYPTEWANMVSGLADEVENLRRWKDIVLPAIKVLRELVLLGETVES